MESIVFIYYEKYSASSMYGVISSVLKGKPWKFYGLSCIYKRKKNSYVYNFWNFYVMIKIKSDVTMSNC